jgi:hypothetical protein
MSKKKKNSKYLPYMCPSHNPILSKMSYLGSFAEADRRMAKGQKQKQCPVCHLWFFKDEF